MKPLIAVIFALMVLPSQAAKKDKEDEKSKSLDEMLFDEGLWSKSLEDLKGPEPEVDEDEEELRKKLKEKGIEMGKGEVEGFAWLSSAKDGLRADPEEFELLGKEVGEVVIRGREGKATEATVSIFNRGDDGEVPFDTFNEKMADWKTLIDEKMAVRGEVRNQKGAVALEGFMWKKGDTAVLLEGSIN